MRATRWTDPLFVDDYVTRLDHIDREAAWPQLTRMLTNPEPRRGFGRPDAIVLELGSGPGHYARYLANKHWTATYAVDISPAIHRHGQLHVRDAWIRRTLPTREGHLPLRRCQCTAALAHLLICHIPHAAQILALLTEAHRVLRPKAPLAIVEPCDFGRDFQFLRFGHPHAGCEPKPGDTYPIYYTLADGRRLRTTAYRHPPHVLAKIIQCAGFHLESISPLALPACGGTPFTLWTAYAT